MADNYEMEELPPDLLDDLDRAADFAEWLAVSHRELSYEIDPLTGKVAVELRDTQGDSLGSLRALDALDLVAGVSPVAA